MFPLLAGHRLQAPYGLAPLNSSLFCPDGSPRPNCLTFYEQYCRPSIGILILGGIAVSDEGRANGTSLVLRSARHAHGIGMVKEKAQRAGTLLVAQIEHAGRQARYQETGSRLLGPTDEPCPVVGGVPQALTLSEIQHVVADFVAAAFFATEGGADLVEINAAHGYLLSSFISPLTNKRTDSYGGSSVARFRLAREVVRAISDRLGRPVGIRVNSQDALDQPQVVDDLLEGLASFKDDLAYVSVSAGTYAEFDDLIMPARAYGENLWSAQSARLRDVGRPILVAGNILNKAGADRMLNGGVADVALFGRALLADPELLEQSAPQACTECGLCKYRTKGFPHIYCPYNPVLAAGESPRTLRRAGRSGT